MNYKPNFRDNRVQARCKHALGFVCGAISDTKPKGWSSRYLDQYLGQIQTNLGKYLRTVLLIPIDQYYNPLTHDCKKYIKNPVGVKFIRDSITGKIDVPWNEYRKRLENTQENIELCDSDEDRLFDQNLVAQFIEKEFGNELRSGDFDYNDKSNRLWHSLQNQRSLYKKVILADYGYEYQYDIVACAPTIIEQLSRKHGNDLWMPHLAEYLDNSSAFRTQIANDFEIDIKTAKVFINSLFCGARIGMSKRFAIAELLDLDPAKILLAKEHQLITGLREDIKTCWNYIINSNTEISRRRNIDTGRLIPVNSSEKWAVYFRYERQTLNVVREYLKSLDIKLFLEHDGWSCDREIDTNELEQVIYDKTGLYLKLKYEQVVPK